MTALQFIRKHDLQSISDFQKLHNDFSRHAIRCRDYAEYDFISRHARNNKVYAGSHFHAKTVYVMDKGSFEKWKEAERKDLERVNNWWERWHNADDETRRLMSCGVIA